jgi:hypothetical protein
VENVWVWVGVGGGYCMSVWVKGLCY